MTDPTVYPLTAEFEAKAAEVIAAVQSKKAVAFLKTMAAYMAETLGEYEHGTADAKDVFAEVGGNVAEDNTVALKAMAAVYMDAFLCASFSATSGPRA